MVNQTETAKLSLVGKHSHAVAFTTPDVNVNQSEAIINCLPAILQTTLELDDLVQLFQDELKKSFLMIAFIISTEVCCAILIPLNEATITVLIA
jgi:hypothetical protein